MEEIKIEFKELDEFTIEDTREVVIQEVPISPPLENLVVTPTREEQVFNHPNSYGYDEVRVEAVQGKTLEVTPNAEEQTFNDLYTNVKIQGDEDLVASNIKQGVEIFGVTGSLEELTTETKDGINNQEEIITNQETTLEEINQVINDKILVKERFKPRYTYQPIKFQAYKGTELDNETTMLDTTYFTDMQNMFYQCSNLTHLDLSGWNTSNVTNMYNFLCMCTKLKEVSLSNLDTSNVTNMFAVFSDCMVLTKLDLSGWDTSNVTTMSNMFGWCYELKHLDIRNFTFNSVTNYSNMFTSVPADCLIIVKGQTEKEFVLNARNTLTNVKTIAELEG